MIIQAGISPEIQERDDLVCAALKCNPVIDIKAVEATYSWGVKIGFKREAWLAGGKQLFSYSHYDACSEDQHKHVAALCRWLSRHSELSIEAIETMHDVSVMVRADVATRIQLNGYLMKGRA